MDQESLREIKATIFAFALLQAHDGDIKKIGETAVHDFFEKYHITRGVMASMPSFEAYLELDMKNVKENMPPIKRLEQQQ